jgi:hypothetical protein
LPLDGGHAEREAPAPWCFVRPAPTGGWTAWIRCAPRTAVLVPPGGVADPSAAGFSIVGSGDLDAAGTMFVYRDQERVYRIDLASGVSTALFRIASDNVDVAVSPDGQTVYTAEKVGRVRRMRIDNFGERPPLR